MAGLENLIPHIYHEKQQEGSMLCAQHALNSLLQGNYLTAPDLSDIARSLDILEHSYDNSHTNSTNMDDTGFFSVQVLENALKVWGLNLTRWRGEEMRPYQDHPHTQLAFILNLELHWFTLRRSGHVEPDMNADTGNLHWFNLNSFNPEPEWVGRLYLGMVLQQAEAEGYSVFAVTQADPSVPLALPHTEADEIASTLPEPASAARPAFNPTSYKPPLIPSSSTPGGSMQIDGLEDEDYELQAALQASLSGGGYDYHYAPLLPPALGHSFTRPPSDGVESPPYTSTRTPTGEEIMPGSYGPSVEQDEELDPVQASMQRNQLMLQRMRQEQEFAQRELWAEGTTGTDEARMAERRRDAEEEAEQLRRAIEESEAIARAEGHAPQDGDDDEVDDGMATDRSALNVPPGKFTPGGHAKGDRVYDDDDTELQAALKASLEQVPQGWELPELPSQRTPVRPLSAADLPHPAAVSPGEDNEMDDAVSIVSSETEDHAPEAVSVDELRRRRLARFGA